MKLCKATTVALLVAVMATAFACEGYAQNYFPPTTTVNLTYIPVNLSFYNYGTTPQYFSATFQTTPFSPLNFSAGSVRASLGISLTDATSGETGVALSNLSETSQLSDVSGNTTIASASLPNATLTITSSNPLSVLAGNGAAVETLSTSGFVSDPLIGSFNVLSVTISGQLPANSTIGLTGRVDVQAPLDVTAVPEPSSGTLELIAALIFTSCLRRKIVR